MILVGDNRETLSTLEDGAYQALFTSPPYFGLRLYGDAGEEIGKERALDAYVASIVDVMRLCRAKMRDDGVAWVNLGDSYAQGEQRHRQGQGSSGPRNRAAESYSQGTAQTGRRLEHGFESGNALLVPFRVATALQQDGWTLRAMLPWVKFAGMPESVQSRPCVAHEYVLFLTKRPSGYFYDADAVRVAQSENTHARGKDGSMAQERARFGNVHANTGGPPGKRSPMTDHPAGRSYRSSDVWRAGAREAAIDVLVQSILRTVDTLTPEQAAPLLEGLSTSLALLAAADGQAIGLVTNDDAPAALVVNPKGSGIPHFAMWPTRLVAPMVLASTPEKVCGACGAPWRRVVELGEMRASDGRDQFGAYSVRRARGETSGPQPQSGHGGGTAAMPRRERHQRGFSPSCACDAPTRPARILDPFAGAATTIAVAEALGREATGCELYQKNADLYPQRKAIVAAEVADYLRERGEGDKAAAADADPKQIVIPGC